MLLAAPINSQDTWATLASIGRCMDKDVVYMHKGMFLGHKKEWNNAICSTWMDLEMIILSELSQRERKTNTWYHLYMESKKNDINELIYKTEVDSET